MLFPSIVGLQKSLKGGNFMSKGNSGLFNGTNGSKNGRIIPGKDGVVTGGNSSTLGRNMLKEMGISKGKWTGYQAQHIIPAQMADHPVLQKIGMNLDDASNGVFLRIPGKNISALSRHRGFHSVYSEFVKQELNKIKLSNDSATIQKQVQALQNKLRKLQNSGLPLYSSEGATVDLWRKHYNKLK